jgi:hypothetical protein
VESLSKSERLFLWACWRRLPPEADPRDESVLRILAEHCRFDEERAARLHELFPEEWGKMLRKRAELRLL